MKLLLIFILCSAFIAFKPEKVGESILRRPVKVQAFGAVQTAGNENDGSTSTVDITVSGTTLNNLVVVSIFTVAATTITSVTDNQSNTYVLLSARLSGSSTYKCWQAYGVQAASGATTITVTASGNALIIACADEYSGGATTNAAVFDVSSDGAGNGTSLSVSTLTPSASGKLIVASMVQGAGPTWTAGTDYTLYGTGLYFGLFEIVRSQYRLSGTTSETAPATLSTSQEWAEIATSFNAPAAATNTSGFFNFFKP